MFFFFTVPCDAYLQKEQKIKRFLKNNSRKVLQCPTQTGKFQPTHSGLPQLLFAKRQELLFATTRAKKYNVPRMEATTGRAEIYRITNIQLLQYFDTVPLMGIDGRV